ncbi:NAD/NADP octopine/nopaline dehydrogenase family protein [Anaeromicrobium sediminis]|uniref:NAD/NADP octopine/nopaline dehydrogenase n=1 Tax=Anaeromicrobium sediminis TaxID=1478221 RepID=A0A267MLN5_9FIRM|nr:NAD/NADP octopine/nopaline dehydrogenase family protein [Anaeromicrobium sediminis]PAB59785.1 NAD/NADP octopine/nopaline dehydrogenase [Anaeromicrobium sediminis]
MIGEYKFAILGCGNGGKALAGQIASQGYSVSMFEALSESEDFKKFQQEKNLHVRGSISCDGALDLITTNMKEAVKDRDIIFVVVPAFAHKPIFELLVPHLEDGQKVIVTPGNYSTFMIKKIMNEMNVHKNISITEVASLPYACRATSHDTVMVYKQKNKLKIATCPTDKNDEILKIMNSISDIYIPAKNVLEVSLDNFNAILHPLPVLLNIAGIEKNSDNFRHYIDGVSPLVSKKMEEMDEERLYIGKEYDLNLISTLEQEKMYYGLNDSSSLYEYFNSDESPYKEIYGQNVFGRYITEDLPYLLVPASQLAQKVGVDTPLLDMCISLASTLHDKDYMENGYNLEHLGISHMTKEEILDYSSNMIF